MTNGQRITITVKQRTNGFWEGDRFHANVVDERGQVYVGVFPAFHISPSRYTTLTATYSHRSICGDIYVKNVRARRAVKK